MHGLLLAHLAQAGPFLLRTASGTGPQLIFQARLMQSVRCRRNVSTNSKFALGTTRSVELSKLSDNPYGGRFYKRARAACGMYARAQAECSFGVRQGGGMGQAGRHVVR